jgi:hypothetical protein
VASYLAAVHAEALCRGYRFDAGRIGSGSFPGRIDATKEELLYE